MSCQGLTGGAAYFITDNLAKEGFEQLVKHEVKLRKLFIIDKFLPDRLSRFGSLVRNLVKAILLPLQILLLRRTIRGLINPFIFAHSTYYAFLASFTPIPYSATPQGSEVLVRPQKSLLYRLFLLRSVKKAKFVTVDSTAMRDVLCRMISTEVLIIQNGIDLSAIRRTAYDNSTTKENNLLSVRGIAENYQIHELVIERNREFSTLSIDFVYPFCEEVYYKQILDIISKNDKLMGKLGRHDLYKKMREARVVVSIPKSDSSPRSVYEALACGAVVITTYHSFIDSIPSELSDRIVLVDPSERGWLKQALIIVDRLSKTPFKYSEDLFSSFNQIESMRKKLSIVSSIYSSPRPF